MQTRRAEIADDVDKAVQAQGIIDSLEVLRHDYYFVRRYSCEKEQADLELQRHIEESRLDGLEKWSRLWALGLKHYEARLKDYGGNQEASSRLDALTSHKDAIHRMAFRLSTGVRDIMTRRNVLAHELDL